MAGGEKDARKGQEKIKAAVLDAAAKMLKKTIKEEVHMLLRVPKEIDKIRVKLDDIKNFLADADRRNITDLNVQTLVTELRGAMHDATNIINFCRLKAMDQGPSQDMGCFSPLLFCLRNPLHTHRIGRRIKNLNKKLSDIKARGELFNFANLASYEDHGRKEIASPPFTCETSGELDESGLVGEKIKAVELHHHVDKIELQTAWSSHKKQATPKGEQPKTPTAAARVQEMEVEVTAEKQGAAALKDQFHGQKDELEVLKKVEESEEAREKHAEEIENLKKQAEETHALLQRLVTLNKD